MAKAIICDRCSSVEAIETPRGTLSYSGSAERPTYSNADLNFRLHLCYPCQRSLLAWKKNSSTEGE